MRTMSTVKWGQWRIRDVWMERGEGHTVCSTRDGIRFSTGRSGILVMVAVYPSDFNIVKKNLAMTTREVPLGRQLDVFFVPVDHGYGHLGTTPGPFDADGQQEL